MNKRLAAFSLWTTLLWLHALMFSVLIVTRTFAQDGAEEEEQIEYEYVYEYEYEYGYQGGEGAAAGAYGGSEEEYKAPEKFYGFHKSVGGGMLKVTQPLVDELYLNITSDDFDCIKKVESRIAAPEIEETEEDKEPDIAQQVNDLRKKMEEVANIAASLANGTDIRLIENSTATAQNNNPNSTTAEGGNSTTTDGESREEESAPKKRLSFREKQELRMKERREAEAMREKVRPKFRLGADCETLVCGSCKAIVEEFGVAVHKAVNDSNYRYIEDVGADLCKKREISLKYIDLLGHVCSSFETERTGYKEALMLPFEEDTDWENIADLRKLHAKKIKICLEVGACEPEQFDFQITPAWEQQEQWDDKCYVCQAFANDLEERVQLTRHVTEVSIVPIVAATCDRLNLEPYYDNTCKPLTTGRLLDDIAWLTKVHGESVIRKARGEQAFADKLCEEIDWCKPWVDPVLLREKQARQTMEAVFF